MKNKAILLDRDGVINENCEHTDIIDIKGKICRDPLDLDDFKILPEVKEAILEFKKLGYEIVVVSNQPGLVKEFFTKELLEEINEVMKKELGLEHIYCCLHHPDYSGECDCRKPKPGLLLKAAKDLNIDLGRSYMVGDRDVDIAAGKKAGCKTVLIGENKDINSDLIFNSLFEFSQFLKKA